MDGARVHALLFAEPTGAGHAVSRATRRVALFSITVPGVPAIHVEEALWTCAALLGARRRTNAKVRSQMRR